MLMSLTIKLFEHPPFQEKAINYCNPSVRTPMFESIIPISKHLRLVELDQGSLYVYKTAEHLLAFDSLRRARARVTECLLAYYRRFRTCTRFLQSKYLLDSYCHCGA